MLQGPLWMTDRAPAMGSLTVERGRGEGLKPERSLTWRVRRGARREDVDERGVGYGSQCVAIWRESGLLWIELGAGSRT